MTTQSVTNSLSRPPLRRCLPRKQQLTRAQPIRIIRGFGLIPLALVLVLLALSPTARAVDPPPDGGYPNNNTAEGEDALFSLTSGFGNAANGFGALYSNTTGNHNTAIGYDALYNNTTGSYNTANGSLALTFNTTANNNTAIGFEALNNNTGTENTAIGSIALFRNTTGSDNTASGVSALVFNTTGNSNTANGANALYSNTIGSRNVATGSSALYSNQIGGDNTATGVNAFYYNTGNYNTAQGYQALESNTTGSNNTASGLNALNHNTTGNNNSANGAWALYNATTASNNCATGYKALYLNTTGYQDTAIGELALYKNTSGINNVALGINALYGNTTGNTNIGVGFSAGLSLTTGSNNIDIGNFGVAAESNTIRIGTMGTQTNTYVAGIYGATTSAGIGVFVDSNGHLGTLVSSERFKEAITPMDRASEAILFLKPVTFRYKQELDPKAIPQFGLIAEEVEKVNPALVVRDAEGKPYTVRYEAVNAMLLNEFLKERRKIDGLEATIAHLESAAAQQRNLQTTVMRQQEQIDRLIAALKEQPSQIRKVSAEVEIRKPPLQAVVNSQ
jgi:hypothetical protein